MYQIALCDDEEAELNKIKDILKIYQREHPELDLVTECFDSAEMLLSVISKGEYIPDIVLMDIYMSGKTGIEAARELRRLGNPSKIIFLTTSVEHALEAFRVDATQYLVKPVSKKKLSALLDKLLDNTVEEQKRYVVLQTGNKALRVSVNDLVFCEAQRKSQYLYLTDGTQLCLRMSMAALADLFSDFQEIVRVGSGYIVNLKYVKSLSGQELLLDGGKKIYPPRGSYQTLKEQYFDYYCGNLASDDTQGRIV